MKRSFLEGKVLDTKRYGYKVTLGKLLSEGATAYIYLATMKKNDSEMDVVVKMSKLGQNNFVEEEGVILEKAFSYYNGRNQPSPFLEDTGSFDEQPFLVMENLSLKTNGGASPALNIVREKGVLTESQVLSLAVELFHFLVFLHVECKVTYPDFKLDNIWLESTGSEAFHLRLLDLGGLRPIESSSPEDADCQKDLVVAGSHLFSLISGNTYALLSGEVTEQVRIALREISEENMSWGTRRFFKQLFARPGVFRPSSAVEEERKVKELLNLWVFSEQELYEYSHHKDVKAAEADPNNEEGVDERNAMLADAYAGFDIVVRRFESFNPAYRDKLEDVKSKYNATSHLEQGRAKLQSGSYDAALAEFKKGLEFDDHPLLFQCWYSLALILQQLNDSRYYPVAEDVGAAFEREKYDEVLGLLERFPASQIVEVLKLESGIFSAYKRADENISQHKYPIAIAELKKAGELLLKIPEENREEIEKNKGSVIVLIEKYEEINDREEKETYYKILYEELKSSSDLFSKRYFLILRQYVAAGRYSSNMAKDAADLLSIVFKKSPERGIENISRVAEALFWSVPEKSEIGTLYEASRKLSETYVWIQAGNVDAKNGVFENLEELVKSSEKNKEIKPKVRFLLELLAGKVYAVDDLSFWEGLRDLSKLLNDKILSKKIASRIKEIKNKQRPAGFEWKKIWIPAVLTVFAFICGVILPPVIKPSIADPTVAPTITAVSPAPTQTSTPPPTPTATSLPVSAFVLNVGSLIQPRLPLDPEIIWQFPAPAPCPSDPHFCSSMDVPFEAGVYDIYIYNDLSATSMKSQLNFQITLKTPDSLLINPHSNTMGSVQLGTKDYINDPLVATWIWVGTYEFKDPGVVNMKISANDGTAVEPQDIERVIIVRQNVPSGLLPPAQHGNFKWISIINDSALNELNLSALSMPDPTSWNGDVTLAENGSVTIPGVLQPGKYGVFYRVSGTTTGSGTIRVLGGKDGKEFGKTDFDQNASASGWISVDFLLEAPAMVKLEFTGLNGTPIPVDVFFVYKME